MKTPKLITAVGPMTPAALSALAKGDLKNFAVADTPGGIEAQEERGQQAFVASATLPRKFNSGTQADLEAAGVVFRKAIDNLFCEATLPEGWVVQPTDHHMWNKLIDNKGRERASIFYKAAFYDRSAHINVNTRFNYSCYESCDSEGNLAPYETATNLSTVITDGGKQIHLIGVRDKDSRNYDLSDQHRVEAVAWLNDNYPDWQSNTAYWD